MTTLEALSSRSKVQKGRSKGTTNGRIRGDPKTETQGRPLEESRGNPKTIDDRRMSTRCRHGPSDGGREAARGDQLLGRNNGRRSGGERSSTSEREEGCVAASYERGGRMVGFERAAESRPPSIARNMDGSMLRWTRRNSWSEDKTTKPNDGNGRLPNCGKHCFTRRDTHQTANHLVPRAKNDMGR